MASSENKKDSLVQRLARYMGGADTATYLGIHQRLDKETSGVLVMSKRAEANPALAKQFEQRSVLKRYVAAVENWPTDWQNKTVTHQLSNRQCGRVRVLKRGGKTASCRISVRQRHQQRTLLNIDILTGRTHQIRVQLAELGYPIVGDTLYGSKLAAERLMLHSCLLQLRHPNDGRAMEFNAPLPPSMLQWFRSQAGSADDSIWEERLQRAMVRRYDLAEQAIVGTTTCFRLIHGQADGFDGLFLDVYGPWLVAQLEQQTLSADYRQLFEKLCALGYRGVFTKYRSKRSDNLSNKDDTQFAPKAPIVGQACPETVLVSESKRLYQVRLSEGMATGIYLDQRKQRDLVSEMAEGKRVLNLFCYTGAFTIAALHGCAKEVVSVDIAAPALHWLEQNQMMCKNRDGSHIWRGDVFDVLGRLQKKKRVFDLVIVDPPTHATARGRRFRVERDYDRLVQEIAAVLAPSAKVLASCNTRRLSRQKFLKLVRRGLDQGKRAIEEFEWIDSAEDFPVVMHTQPQLKSLYIKVR